MSIFDGRASEILFATVLESKYMRRRLALNASVADIFDGVSGGDHGASRRFVVAIYWKIVSHHLRMGQKVLKLVRRDLDRVFR